MHFWVFCLNYIGNQTNIKSSFPAHLPINLVRLKIKENKSFALGFMEQTNRVFHSSPTTNSDSYLNWLHKIENKKEHTWKDQGIFELIQLSIIEPRYNPNMLIASVCY